MKESRGPALLPAPSLWARLLPLPFPGVLTLLSPVSFFPPQTLLPSPLSEEPQGFSPWCPMYFQLCFPPRHSAQIFPYATLPGTLKRLSSSPHSQQWLVRHMGVNDSQGPYGFQIESRTQEDDCVGTWLMKVLSPVATVSAQSSITLQLRGSIPQSGWAGFKPSSTLTLTAPGSSSAQISHLQN